MLPLVCRDTENGAMETTYEVKIPLVEPAIVICARVGSWSGLVRRN